MIEIKCSGKDFLSLNELKDFQGSLKTLSDANYKKLKKQIEEHGFCVPFFVWQDGKSNYILDGHQREKVLRRMGKDGIEIPDKFPVVFVEAKNRNDAANKLLAINSQYGEISSEGLYDFMNDFDINFDSINNFEFPTIDMDSLFNMFDENIPDFQEENKIDRLDKLKEIICPECGCKFKNENR